MAFVPVSNATLLGAKIDIHHPRARVLIQLSAAQLTIFNNLLNVGHYSCSGARNGAWHVVTGRVKRKTRG